MNLEQRSQGCGRWGGRLKAVLCCLLSAFYFCSDGATVTGDVRRVTLTAATTLIRFSPLDAPQADGELTIIGGGVNITPTNGLFSTTLQAGRYTVSFAPPAGNISIIVPTGTGTYNLNALGSDLKIFTYTNPFAPFSWTNLLDVPAGFADGTDDGGGGGGLSVEAGTNITVQTVDEVATVNADVSHAEVTAATNGLNTALQTALATKQPASVNLTNWSALATSAKQDTDADLDDLADGSLTGSKVGTGINGDNITSGTIAPARIDSAMATDSEVAAGYQPLDSDLTSIAALSTTAFGRGLLDDADAAAGRTSLGVVIGTDVQAHDVDLDDLADGSLTGSKVGAGISGDNITSGTLPDARLSSNVWVNSRSTVNRFDDFMVQPIANQTFNSSIATISGFTVFATGGANVFDQASFIDVGHPGVMYLGTGSTSSGQTGIQQGISVIGLGGGRSIDVTWIWRIFELSDNTDNYQIRLGMHNATTSTEPVNAMMFRYSNNTNSGNIQFVTRANNSQSVSNTATAIAANTWYTNRFLVNSDATLATLYHNGTIIATLTANIPNINDSTARALSPGSCQIIKAVGSTHKEVAVDWWEMHY